MGAFLHRGLAARAGAAPPACSRRAWLQAAAASVGVLASLDRPAQARGKDLPRVLVVGAGFSGLACADELAQRGYDVIVVEARDRVGGRVESLRQFAPGKIIEGGSELVGPNQPTWMAYARRFQFEFVELPWEASDVIHLDGRALAPGEARALWQEMRTALERLNALAATVDADRPWTSAQAESLDRRSLDDWIRSLDVSARCQALIAIQMTGINGLIPAWQSLLGILSIVRGGGLQKFWDETDTLHCVGGTQQLAERLAQSLVERRGASALRLSSPIHRLQIQEKRVVATLADGHTLEVDEVVFTAPPSTWNRVAITPTLPGELVVPMAASTKFLALTRDKVWQRLGRQPNAMSSGPVQLTWETTAGQGEAAPHALVAFSGGREADVCRAWPEGERRQRYAAALDALFPGFASSLIDGRLVDWLADPWARGSYSFPAPGQVTLVGPHWERPHAGRLHFAGEHCSYAFIGWMEGALESGVRLARRLARRDGVEA